MLRCLIPFLLIAFVAGCPGDSVPAYTKGTCWLLKSTPLSFTEAEKFCQSKDGFLTSIHDAFSNQDLQEKAKKEFPNSAGFFIGGKLAQKEWSWTDGSKFDYTDWAKTEPDNTQHCIVVSKAEGTWRTHNCSKPAAFVCTIKPATTFKNPLLQHGADPWVLKHGNFYYYTHTMGNRIGIYKTKAMSELSDAKPVTVWTPPSSGMHSTQIWAPEIHFIDNKFYVYFAADDGNNDNHRIYCIENPSDDPTKGEWTFKGKVYDHANDHWAIDVNHFEYKGSRYLLWSGWEGNVNKAQNIYIAKMSNPWTLEGSRVLISEPEHSWETVGAPPTVNEGPEALINPTGRLFITYSASGCWTDSYALGLLSLEENGNPLNPKHWIKTGHSVFSKDSSSEAFGTGHNGFFKSPDGKEDWIIYHANPKAGQGCGDDRSPRMQKFTWNPDGTPDFGKPVKINTPIEKPSGEE